MSLKEQGVQKFGRLIDQNIAQAAHLAALVEAEPRLELMAPAPINIVCFRHRLPGATEAALKAFNTEIMLRLQEAGTATISDTTLGHRHTLRVAIANHRTRRADLDLLVSEVLRVGAELQRG
jgi:glutamate/tyrosine decarboxylase-like PLP-dependent enzyme